MADVEGAGESGADAEADGTALTLHQSAALVGTYRWVERRLFEVTGEWAAEVAEPEVQVHLDEVSARHGWHEELWADRAPIVGGLDPENLVRPLGATADEVFGALGGEAVPLLAGLYRVVVPRLVTTYQDHLNRAVAVSDGPAIRVLRLALQDEVESWLAGEALLQGLLRTTADAGTAAAVQRRLEAALVGAGDGRGLVPWPG